MDFDKLFDIEGEAALAQARGQRVELDAETVLDMIAEIAALRAEVEAARQAFIIIGDGAHSLHYAGVPAGGQYALQEINRTAKDMLNRLNTFNAAPIETAPAPEPAPEIKVGDSVEVTKSMSEDDAEFVGKVGTVTFITQNDLFKYVVKFRRTKYRMDGSQLRRLD